MALIGSFLQFYVLTITAFISLAKCRPAQQAPLHQNAEPLPLEVPGDNPLVFCSDPESYILDIAYVDMIPNPPEAGKNLTINASGKVAEDIESGAHVKLAVKIALNYGGQIPILIRDIDLCKLMADDDDIETECPVKEDEVVGLSKTVGIPQTPSEGKYIILIDAYTKDEKKITCMGTELTL